MSNTNQNKKCHVVLSSGGARGIAHIGVIEGLLDAGYEIGSIAGSSMGAVVGGVYAAGKLDAFKDWVCNFDRIDVFKLMDFTLSTQGFVRGDKVFNEMRSFIPENNIEDLEIPFTAVATDLNKKTEYVFKSGSLYEALRASAAIPSILKPAVINGRELVDGGVINPIPIAHISPEDGDLVVVSDVNAAVSGSLPEPSVKEKSRFAPLIEKWENFFSKSSNKEKSLSYFELITKSIDLMQDQISSLTMKNSKTDLVILISRDICGTFEFYRAKELIDYGKKEFNEMLKDYELRNVESSAG